MSPVEQKELSRDQKRRYRKNHSTFTISFNKETALELERIARTHGVEVSTYFKKLFEADKSGLGYVLPSDAKLRDVLLALHKTSGNINQLVRYVHSTGSLTDRELTKMQEELASLRNCLTHALTAPPKLSEILTTYLALYPEKRILIITWLQEFDDNKSTAAQNNTEH